MHDAAFEAWMGYFAKHIKQLEKNNPSNIWLLWQTPGEKEKALKNAKKKKKVNKSKAGI